MRNVVLEPVDNGIIKIVSDDNLDGGGKQLEIKKIYSLEDNVDNSIKFLTDLISDLGLYIGNEHTSKMLDIGTRAGKEYKMTPSELIEARKKLTKESIKLNQ